MSARKSFVCFDTTLIRLAAMHITETSAVLGRHVMSEGIKKGANKST